MTSTNPCGNFNNPPSEDGYDHVRGHATEHRVDSSLQSNKVCPSVSVAYDYSAPLPHTMGNHYPNPPSTVPGLPPMMGNHYLPSDSNIRMNPNQPLPMYPNQHPSTIEKVTMTGNNNTHATIDAPSEGHNFNISHNNNSIATIRLGESSALSTASSTATVKSDPTNPLFKVVNGKNAIIIPHEMFPVKVKNITKETAQKFAKYYPWLLQTNETRSFDDGQTDTFIQLLKSIHKSVSVVGQKTFDAEVCTAINQWIANTPSVVQTEIGEMKELTDLQMILYRLKNELPGKSLKIILDMLYNCIHSITFESSAFRNSTLVEEINKYGLERMKPFVIEPSSSNITHSLVAVANKKAKDRRDHVVTIERDVLGLHVNVREPKCKDAKKYVKYEPTVTKMKNSRPKAYVVLDQNLIGEKDVSAIETLDDVITNFFVANENSRLLKRMTQFCDNITNDVKSEQCEETLEHIMRVFIKNGISKQALMDVASKVCEIQLNDEFLHYRFSPFLNKNESLNLLGDGGESLHKDIVQETLSKTQANHPESNPNKNAEGNKECSAHADAETLSKTQAVASESVFQEAFESVASFLEETAVRTNEKRAPLLPSGNENTFDKRDVGLRGAGTAYRIKEVIAKVNNKAFVEWDEKNPGEYRDDRFQLIPMTDLNQDAKNELKAKMDDVEYIPLGLGVSDSGYCVHMFYFL